MSIIDKLVEDSQFIIKDDRKKDIEKVFSMLEEFLSTHAIPVNSDYDEINFYQYHAYPIMNFTNFANTIKSEIVESTSGVFLSYFIYKYIYYVDYNGYHAIMFTNIFWPHENHKYKYKTYTAPARLNPSIELNYIHPKYSLEEIYRRFYCPEYFDEVEELHVKKNQLMQMWKKLNPDNAPTTSAESIQLRFGKYQQQFIDKVGKLFVSAHYDETMPIFIGSKSAVDKAKIIMSETFKNVQVLENSSKSFFDPRTINYMFKIDNMILGKVWQILDNEVIPVLPFNKSKSHISVPIKLALTEHITYEILGFDNIAKDKLNLFCKLISSEKSLKKRGMYTKLTECKFVGTYFPLDKYLSTLRTDELVEKFNKKA
jgi:hypothetical protein